MNEDILIPLASFAMVVGIVGLVQAGKTVRHYLDWRLRMVDRQSGVGDGSVLRAIQELRAEIAALKQHESEAVLSFDSTLQTMNARLQHLERRALAGGNEEMVGVGR
jgi:hypothetical protein